jgi:protein-disulfide isomerase
MDAESAEVDPNNPQQAQQISRVFHEGQIWIRLFPADDSYNAEDVVVLDNGVWSQIQNPIPADGIKVVTDSTCAICPPADQLQQAIFSSIPFIAAETASEIPVIDASTDEVPSGLGQIPSFVFTDAVKVNSIFNEEFFASFPEVEGGVAVDPGTLGLPINAKIVIDQNQLPAEVPTEPELTIVEYSDFTCSFCARFASQTKPKILEKYGDQVVIDYRHMARGPGSYPPAIAAECVKQVGTEEQFWQFHDLAFADISDLSTETLTAHAETAGVPLAEFTSCVANEETRAIVEADTAEAQRLGVTGTPGFYIDNIFIGGALPFESFDPLIASKLAE